MSDEWISLVSRGVGWLIILVELGVAVAALARLRLSAAGVCLALGFGGLALNGMFYQLVFALYFRPALESGEYFEIETSMTALSLLTSGAAILFWILIGVGGISIPSSLKRR